MIRKCRICKKQFDVLYPELWRYKQTSGLNVSAWFCSWKCLRANENKKKEGSEKMNSQVETGRELIEVIEQGGDPIEYLKGKGYAHPDKAYQNIKYKCREADPELGARFPKRLSHTTVVTAKELPEEAKWEKLERIEKDFADRGVELVYDPGIAEEYRQEQEQKKANERARAEAEREPVNILNGYEVHGIEVTAYLTGTGEFYHDKKFRTIDWRSKEGEEISLVPEDWQKLSDEIPTMLKIFGAEK